MTGERHRSAQADDSPRDDAGTGVRDERRFDFTGWLEADGSTGVDAGASTSTEVRPTEATVDEGRRFDFTGWLAAGGSTRAVPGEAKSETDFAAEPSGTPGEPSGSSISQAIEGGPGPSAGVGDAAPTTAGETLEASTLHPARVATYAAFVACVTLAGLTVAGLLPPLGPVTGL